MKVETTFFGSVAYCTDEEKKQLSSELLKWAGRNIKTK